MSHRPAGGFHDEWRGTGQRHRGAKARRCREVRYPVRAGRVGAVDDITVADRDFKIGPQPAADRLDHCLLAGPQVREPVSSLARVVTRRDITGLNRRKEPGGQPRSVQVGRHVLDVDTHRAVGADGHRDHVRRVREAGVHRGPGGSELGFAVPAGCPGERRGPRFQFAGDQDPERAVCHREALPVSRVQERRGAGALTVVEHVPAPGRGVWWHVDRDDPYPDPADSGGDDFFVPARGTAQSAGHGRTSAIRAARRRAPS